MIAKVYRDSVVFLRRGTKPFSARLGFVSTGIVACLSIVSCQDRQSSFFFDLDINSDNEISFAEWWRYYGDHQDDLYSCFRRDFYLADCDKNDYLSWDEYWDHRKSHKYCSHFEELIQAGPAATIEFLRSEEQRLLATIPEVGNTAVAK